MHRPHGTTGSAAAAGLLECTPDLVPRDDSLEAAVAVDGHQRSEPHQRRGAEQRLERLVGAHAHVVVLGSQYLSDREHRLAVVGDALGALAIHDPEELARCASTTGNQS